jgi:alanyl aminopeptidase
MGTRTVEAWRPPMHAALDLQKAINRAMLNDALVTARAIRQPLKSVKDIRDQFDGLTYQKGAGVLGMFERLVGVEAFRQGVSGYLQAHADGSGSTDDLLASISRAAGRDVTPAFHTFLDQAGVPLVRATVACGARPRLELRQSRYFPLGSAGTQDRTWQVPVCARFSVGGQVSERCTLLEGTEGELALPGCPDWVFPNARGAGYYRWSLAGDDLRQLTARGYPQLAVEERVALAATLRASVNAGSLPVADALAALGPIAADAEGEVASEAIPLLNAVRDWVLPPSRRVQANAYAVELFGPVLRRLGFASRQGEPPSARRLRVEAMRLLAAAGHPEVVREAARLGRAYAGLEDGRFHPEAVDPDLAELALGVAVEHGDRAIFDALLARLPTTDDTALRGRILDALGHARDPERSARALALTLDPQLRKQEGLTELFQQSQDPRTRDAAWRFLQAHFDAVLAKIPEPYAPYLPSLANFCDAAHAAELKAFFEPRAAKIAGLAKSVRQAEESVRLCEARALGQRASAERFFANRAARKVPTPGGR